MNINAIGLSGFAGCGKSEVARHMERAYGVRRQHIAEPLRGMLRPLLKAYGLDDETIWAYLEGPLKEAVIPEFGRTSREMQITLGTEWGRRLVSDDIWVGAWERSVDPDIVAVNDSVRFPNERDAIVRLGGFVIQIHRPGVGPAKFTSSLGRLGHRLWGGMVGVHASERIDLIESDYGIVNDGTIEQLHAKVDWIMEENGFDKIPAGVTVRYRPSPPKAKNAPVGVLKFAA